MSLSSVNSSDLSLSEETRGSDEEDTNHEDATLSSSTSSTATQSAISPFRKQLTRTTSVLTPPTNAGEGTSTDAFQPFSPSLDSFKVTPWAPLPSATANDTKKKHKNKLKRSRKGKEEEEVGEDAKIMLSRNIEDLTLEQLEKLHQEALQLVLMCSTVRIKKEKVEREKERIERERLEREKRKMKKKEKMRKLREREERLERERSKEAQLQLEREIKEAREALEFDREARLPLEREVREKTEDEEDSEEDDEVTQEDKREKAKVAVCMVDLWDLGASEEPKIEESLRALQTLSQKERNRKWIRISGAIPLLVDILKSPPDPKNNPLTIKESTVLNILATLARNAVNRDEMRQHDSLSIFLRFLDVSNPEDLVNALKLLKELAKSPQNLAVLREQKMIETILPMIKSDNEQVVCGALDIIYVVCLHNPVSQSIVRAGGGVPVVASLIDHASRDVRKRAIRALGSVSSENFKIQKTFHKGPTMQKLVGMLSSDDEDLLREAAGSIASLTDNDYDNQTLVRKLGGLGPIVSLLQHSSDGVKDQACAALRAVVKGNGKSQNELRNLNCIPALISNLCCDDDRIKEHAAGALLELARNNARNQKAIVDAGAIGPIVQALTSDSQVLVYLAEGAVWALGSGKDRSIRSALREAHAVAMLKNIITNSPIKKLKQGAQWALEILEEK